MTNKEATQRGAEVAEVNMESATTVTMVLAGLFFSLMIALLMEELVFGGLFWFFFGERARGRRETKADASLRSL